MCSVQYSIVQCMAMWSQPRAERGDSLVDTDQHRLKISTPQKVRMLVIQEVRGQCAPTVLAPEDNESMQRVSRFTYCAVLKWFYLAFRMKPDQEEVCSEVGRTHDARQ